jgi:hypothetical protein
LTTTCVVFWDSWVRLAVIRSPTGRGLLDAKEELCGTSDWL